MKESRCRKVHVRIEEEDKAYDILPFSAIGHVVLTNNGQGLDCDYGNFIKLISFNSSS